MAETVVFYFSGTGNSLYVAKSLAENLPDAQIVSMPHCLGKQEVYKSKNIGFVFPVYAWDAPPVVWEFINQLDIQNAQYLFAIPTCYMIPGSSLSTVNRLLNYKSLDLHYGKILRMVGNCITSYDIHQNVKKVLERADKQLSHIISDVQSKRHNQAKARNSLTSSSHGSIYTTIDFTANGNCDSCGLCASICPTHNIRLVAGKPIYSHHCLQCMACIQWCPQKAINYGSATKNRKRYHHPKISAPELFMTDT